MSCEFCIKLLYHSFLWNFVVKLYRCKTCNCESLYYIGSYCLNVEKMELLFSAIIF